MGWVTGESVSRIRLALLGMTLLVVSACAPGTENSAPLVTQGTVSTISTSPTTVTSTTVPSTTNVDTTTLAPVDTTTAPSEIPLPDTTGDDWLRIAQEISRFGAYLGEHPDIALVDEIASEGSTVHRFLSTEMAEYVRNGWRDLPGGERRVLVAELAAGSSDSATVVLRVASEDNGFTTVDAAGNVVKEEPPLEPTVSTWTLEGSSSEGWRLAEATFVGPYEVGG